VKERKKTIEEPKINFVIVKDKQQAWDDLMRLTSDNDSDVRCNAVSALVNAFSHVPDKQQAWEDLIRLTSNNDSFVCTFAGWALVNAFSHVPDKQQAWEDLIRLTSDNDKIVCTYAAFALGNAFSHVPDKQQAWEDLHKLTSDNASWMRRLYASALGNVFLHVPDKQQAWEDLHRLTSDDFGDVRSGAASALGNAFSHVLDKQQAWEDLHKLTSDSHGDARSGAASALGNAFSYVLDKQQAWEDLHKLTSDIKSWVRSEATSALGSAFSHVPDKQQAWEDLHRLTMDDDNHVRINAYHSLGRISIFNACESESEEGFRTEIKNAIGFFENASNESTFFNPASFCLPFYRLFYSLTFKKDQVDAEVKQYLTEAKTAIEDSKSKEILLEAVEYLSKAIKEVQKHRDFDDMKNDLNAYRRYCERAADMLDAADERAPSTARLVRRGLPIIDEKIREIIGEIQEQAKEIYTHTTDTPLKDFGIKTCNQAKELSLQNPLELDLGLGRIINTAMDLCEYIRLDDKRMVVYEKLKSLENMEILEKVKIFSEVFEEIPKYLNIPRIQIIHICNTQEKIVRVAVIQLFYNLSKSFPLVVENIDSVKVKIFSGLDIAKNNGTNIACLPELCLCEEWIPEIHTNYPDMIVIGGGYYKDNRNICPVIMNSDLTLDTQSKITPAASEDTEMWENGMIPGDRIYKFETRFGKFIILICRDFERFAHYFRESDIDFIFCPAFNEANDRFHVEANNHVTKTPSYILIANTGIYGGSSIFGQLDNRHFDRLVSEGCKDEGDLPFKLCEAKIKNDEVIIADFNLAHKSIQKPVPSESFIEKRSVKKIKKIPIIPSTISNLVE